MRLRELLVGGEGGGSAVADAGLMLLRGFAGGTLMLAHGMGKMPPSAQFVSGVGQLGFPLPELFAWAASLAEFAGGGLLAIGLLTRPAALFVLFTMAVAAFGQHRADPFNVKEMALLYGFIALAFLFTGSGRYGFDALLRRRSGDVHGDLKS